MAQDMQMVWRGAKLADALAETDELKTTVMERGVLKVVFIRPNIEKTDTHERDEVYVVTQGEISLTIDGVENRLATGDAAFVAAGVEHTFHGLTDDVLLWSMRATPSA
ncbi:MAG: cupin domain-containing protein [Pseudomonadota bacterium]